MNYAPERIVCLTEEPTETLYLLGEQDRIVGISGFTVRPPQARKDKPKVSTFLDAKFDEIIGLKPDLIIGFSDIQADIARELIKRGITVWINNYRSVQGILQMIGQLGAIVGRQDRAHELISDIQSLIDSTVKASSAWRIKPRVYFEEWYDPLISGICWVSEIIEIAGGRDIFPENREQPLAKGRIVTPLDVIARDPDIILASWCGKMVKKDKIISRQGWSTVSAIKEGQIHEIKSSVILQPGPAALIDGIPQVHALISAWVESTHRAH